VNVNQAKSDGLHQNVVPGAVLQIRASFESAEVHAELTNGDAQ